MFIQWQRFWVPKDGHSAREYEDAFAGNAEAGRFAIADGATESFLAGPWARALVKSFVRGHLRGPEQWIAALLPLQQKWAGRYDGQSLPWYAEMKLQQGAFAAFFGLVVKEPWYWGRRRWWAVAVGDSCLFQIRAGCLCHGFPITNAAEFGNRPALVGSRDAPEDVFEKQQFCSRGNWEPGDLLLLFTDALAQWFLLQHEGSKKPWEQVERILLQSEAPARKAAFKDWVAELREKRELRNDDTTMLAIRL